MAWHLSPKQKIWIIFLTATSFYSYVQMRTSSMQLTLYKSINYFRYEGIIVNAEEVVRRCSSKTLFLKTCNIHRKGPLLKDLSNKERFPNAGIFLWILQNFYNQRFFIEHLWWLLLSMIKVCSIPLWMTNEWQINNNNHHSAWTILFSNKTKFKWNCKLLWWFSSLLLVSWNMIIIFVEKLT